MPSGGKRAGAGRKPKSLSEKLLDGNPGKREIKINKFPVKNSIISVKKCAKNIPEYIDMAAKEGGDELPAASDIFKFISDFAVSSGCENLIASFLLEDFAFLRRSYLECEYMNKKLGRIVSKKRSPYTVMALDYHKAMMSVYNQIWNIISRNTETKYESKNDFFEMLQNRGF